MKKIIIPVQNGGLPLRSNDITDLQQQIYNTLEFQHLALQELVPGNTETGRGIIVRGCNIRPGGSNTNFNVDNLVNSMVFLNGEFMRFSGTNNTQNFTSQTYIVEATPVIEQRLFADGVIRNVITERRYTFSSTLPSSGEYILVRPSLGEPRRKNAVEFNSTTRVGMTMELNATDRPLFDNGTGLGTGFWYGWAIADGRNGTIDRRSRVTLGWNSEALTTPIDNTSILEGEANRNNTGQIGNIGGRQSVSLDVTQLPVQNPTPVTFNNIDILSRVGTLGISNSALGSENLIYRPYDGTGSNAIFGNNISGHPSLPSGQGPSTINATVSTGGGGFGHENRMPYVTMFVVQKVF